MHVFYCWMQAVLFYLPSTVWHGLNSRAGVDVDDVISASHVLSTVDVSETHEMTLKLIVKQFDRFLKFRKQQCTCSFRLRYRIISKRLSVCLFGPLRLFRLPILSVITKLFVLHRLTPYVWHMTCFLICESTFLNERQNSEPTKVGRHSCKVWQWKLILVPLPHRESLISCCIAKFLLSHLVKSKQVYIRLLFSRLPAVCCICSYV